MASLNFDYSLQNNTVADATHVMANFTNVKTFVEASSVQVDGSVQAGTDAIANNAVTAAKLAPELPKGVIAKEIKTTDSSTITSGAVNGFTGVTFTPVVGRIYRISASVFSLITYNDLFADTFNIAIVDGANAAVQYFFPPQPGTFVASTSSFTDSFLFVPSTSASVTFNVRLTITAGGPSCKFIGGTGYQNYILVEDLGLA